NEGNFHGYHIAFRQNETQDPTIINLPSYAGILRYEPFDYLTTDQIVITNVDYSSVGTYCFSVYPFVYNSEEPSGYKSYPNGIWQCVKTEILRPDIIQFPGFLDGSTSGNSVMLSWETPTGGVFDQFEIFVKKGDGSFSFNTAKAQTNAGNTSNSFKVIALPDEKNQLLDLPNGK